MDKEEIFGKRGRPADQLAAVIIGQGGSVKNQFVAAAGQVHHQQGAALLPGQGGGGFLPLRLPAEAVRGGCRNDQQPPLCRRTARLRQQRAVLRLKGVLADGYRHHEFAPRLIGGRTTAGEISVFLKRNPLFQDRLRIGGCYFSPFEQERGVAEPALQAAACSQQHGGRRVCRQRRQLPLDKRLRLRNKAAIKQQVLRRAAGKGHLRVDHQPGPILPRFLKKFFDPGGILPQSSGHGVWLSEGNKHRVILLKQTLPDSEEHPREPEIA